MTFISWRPEVEDPNITTDPEGSIVFEWWAGSRKLTMYVQEDRFLYVKVWGPDMNSEMEDGTASNAALAAEVLSWLYEE